jgi:hypothetical protein
MHMFTTKKNLRTLALGTVLLLGAATAGAQAIGPSAAQSPLQGTWNVTVTPYVCATGAALTFATFKARLAFSAGGTMMETNFNTSFQPGQRSPGLGSWERTGPSTYSAVFEAYVYFDALPRYTRGQQRVDQSIEMQDADHWTSSALVNFYDANGAPFSNGCFNATAVRQH